MNEYSRIVIEDYCMTHNSAKSRRLQALVELSYDLAAKVQTTMQSIWREQSAGRRIRN